MRWILDAEAMITAVVDLRLNTREPPWSDQVYLVDAPLMSLHTSYDFARAISWHARYRFPLI
jgi:hypothetical protein